MEKLRIDLPILVEGKYDKITLSSYVDAKIISLSGFGVFNSKEKQLLIKRLAEVGGIILLADSDAGGRQIRSFVSGIIPKEKLFHVYIPEIAGKERRKKTPSRSGLLGVEGMSGETLICALRPFAADSTLAKKGEKKEITKGDFYIDGLSGGENSTTRRALLARLLNLPVNMSANALLDAINMISSYEEYKNAVLKINDTLSKTDKN